MFPFPRCLSAAVVLLGLLPSAQAADQGVIVTAGRITQRINEALADVTVIDRGRIEAATGRTLPELLAREAGVQMWSNGGLGKTSAVSLRGLESRHVLLLVDGVRMVSATVGSPNWDNLPLDAIERIEIVRGPLSGLYGSDAVGGVVQIFTRRGTQGFVPDAVLGAGSRGHVEAAAGARFGSGGLDGALRVQHQRTNGFSATNPSVPFGNHNPDDDGYSQRSATARAGLALGGWRADASWFASRAESAYDDGPGVDARTLLRHQAASLKASGPVLAGWETSLVAGRSLDAIDTLTSASPFAALGVVQTVQHQLSWEHRLATPLGQATAIVERLEQDVQRPGTPFAVSGRTISGAALGLSGRAGAHGWQANVRRDRNSQFGGQTTGALAYGFDLTPALRASASYGTSFVVPSFNQLYFPNFGNPLLRPETGKHLEVDLRWRGEGLDARLAHYVHRIRGYIPSGPLPANVPLSRIEGLSASVAAQLGAWTLGASLDNTDPVNASAASANFGKLLPRRVQETARLAADWRGDAWAFGASLGVQGARFDDVANTTRLGGFAVLDLRADWRFAKDLALALRLNNAGDKHFETVRGYNQPRREGYVTLRWSPA